MRQSLLTNSTTRFTEEMGYIMEQMQETKQVEMLMCVRQMVLSMLIKTLDGIIQEKVEIFTMNNLLVLIKENFLLQLVENK